jgi:hypothetical protein
VYECRPAPNKCLDWVAAPNSKIANIKADGFISISALGKSLLLFLVPRMKIDFYDGPHTGKGKFGMVFLAKQSTKDSSLHVAIKFIPKQVIYDFQNLQKMQCVSLPNPKLRCFIIFVRLYVFVLLSAPLRK